MQNVQPILRIQDLFDRWRQLGAKKLPSGTELIGAMPDGDGEVWMHAIHPGLTLAEIERLEGKLKARLPRDLRAFYRLSRGMDLFQGAFRVYGAGQASFRANEQSLRVDDLLELNHELDVLGWKPKGAVAFAVNAWDQTVHLFGMTPNVREVARCQRATGEILEVCSTLWECISARLYRLDHLLVGS
ncbi:MAG: SMI1/KNR4 family protein [Planctomycetes bacterium]|nr:SMI1/KNR4 family protein [Planctomycetota bacterium]